MRTAICNLLNGGAPSEYNKARVSRHLAAKGQNSANMVSRTSVEDVARRLSIGCARDSSYRISPMDAWAKSGTTLATDIEHTCGRFQPSVLSPQAYKDLAKTLSWFVHIHERVRPTSIHQQAQEDLDDRLLLYQHLHVAPGDFPRHLVAPNHTKLVERTPWLHLQCFRKDTRIQKEAFDRLKTFLGPRQSL